MNFALLSYFQTSVMNIGFSKLQIENFVLLDLYSLFSELTDSYKGCWSLN